MADRWHILTRPDGLTLARRLPARLDLCVRADLPDQNMSLKKLAHQIRQDVWRAAQKLRGFSPVVDLTRRDGVIQIQAGGQIHGRAPVAWAIQEAIAAVLDNRANRCRWIAHAGRGQS